MTDLIIVEFPCKECGEITEIQMKKSQFVKYIKGKELIQRIFPELPAGHRELMISGLCDKCFNKLMEIPEE